MLDVTYPLFPIFSFLGFILVLVPLPWHLQAWNSGTCFFMMWTSLACLNQFVNSVVWAGNVLNKAPWWCEISIRIMMGASVGIPASSLCIVRRLYKIASVQTVSVSPAEKRRIILLDALICILFPLIYIALQYVVQGHRFNIFEDIGCFPVVYNTLLTYFISTMWPAVIGLISAVYCGLALWEFNKRRAQFSQFLNSNTSLTMSRYLRLGALAMIEMCSTTPIGIFVIYLNVSTTKISPWVSWDDTHFGYSRVDQIPGFFWRQNHLLVVSMELTRWLPVFSALVFFSFFGFAQEARKHYRQVYVVLSKYFGFLPVLKLGSSKGSSKKCNLIPGNDSKAIDQLPVYSPAIEDSKFTLSSRGSLSDGASMTDVSSNYEIKTPFTPSTNHSAISPTASYIASPMTSNTLNDRSQNGWTPPATNIALTTFSVALPSDHDSRRFTV